MLSSTNVPVRLEGSERNIRSLVVFFEERPLACLSCVLCGACPAALAGPQFACPRSPVPVPWVLGACTRSLAPVIWGLGIWGLPSLHPIPPSPLSPGSSRIIPMKRLICLLLLMPLLAAACVSVQPAVTVSQSATPYATASLPPTLVATQAPTATPELPAATATPSPIQGTLSIEVNVRSGPGTTYTSLGQLNAGQKVQVTLQDSTGNWYQILYPAAPAGSGWVAAQYVQVGAGTQVPRQATPTPSGPAGRVMQLLNVRSGPGMSFGTLGMLQPNATVSLTGKDATASWFQIVYPAGPGGRAWVTAQYIQTLASDSLPVLDSYGTPVASGTAGAATSLAPATPTVGPAFADNDTAAKPAVSVSFSASGTRQFTYSDQVSAPTGDSEDWVGFTPFTSNGTDARLVFSLTCSGNGRLTVEMWQGGSVLSGWGSLACGDLEKLITLPAGQLYELHLFPASGEGLQLVNYVLTVQNEP